MKGITAFLLCKLRVAKVRTHRAFNSAQWLVDIGPLSGVEITVLYQNMISCFKKDDKYGGYDAVQHMMGIKMAELLVKKGFVNQRPIVKTGTTLRNSGVLELLSYGTWLHRVWCTLVVSPVPDFAERSFGDSEIRPRSARLSNMLARSG